MISFGAPIAALSGLLLGAVSNQPERPIPDVSVLRERVLHNMQSSGEMLERYSCSIREDVQQLDSDGGVKKSESKTIERFYVHGVQIDHLLARDGHKLDEGEARREQARVDKEVKRYSSEEQARKVLDERERQLEMFLHAQRLTDGRRERRNARNTLLFRLQPDPAFRPKNVEERFAQAVNGRLVVDEESGAPIEMHIETTRDVKIGGGVLATLHKGFELDLLRARQPDGLWLNTSVRGNADARAGLFFHPRLRFAELTSACHLYSVDAHETASQPSDSVHKPGRAD